MGDRLAPESVIGLGRYPHQSTDTWLRLHVEAFEELGGVIETVVPDNLKAAVIRAAFGVDGGTALNRSYRELARHCGFKVDPTPPFDPGKKGKVESGVKYVKRNFFRSCTEKDAAVVEDLLSRWVIEIAGTREHGTTHRRPLQVFHDIEQATLRPLPPARFEPTVWKEARVHQDSHVIFDKRLYSVPWKLIGQAVWIRATAATVAIFHDDARVATHARRELGPRSTVDGHLPEHRADLRHRSRSYWEERAAAGITGAGARPSAALLARLTAIPWLREKLRRLDPADDPRQISLL